MRKGLTYVDPMIFDTPVTDPVIGDFVGTSERPLDISALILGISAVIASVFIPAAAYPCGVVGLIYCTRHRRRKRITISMILCILGLVIAVTNNILFSVRLIHLLEALE